MEGLERRSSSSKRIDVVRPVAVFSEGRGGIIRGKTRNISTGGCSLSLDDILEIGENVLFRIDLGDGFDPAVQTATIVWADAGRKRLGVQFSDDRVESKAEAAEPLPSQGSIVKLSIEKMDKPLRVICQDAGKEIVMLRTSIPFLETRKKVTIHYQDGSGKERQIAGTLTDVELEKIEGEPVPFINLTVTREGTPERRPAEKASPAPSMAKEDDPEVEIVGEKPAGSRLAAPEARADGEAGTRDEDDTEPDIRISAAAAQPVTAPVEGPGEPADAFDAKLAIEERITPRYVIIVQNLLKLVIALGLALRAKLGPLAAGLLPAAKKYGPVAARKTGTVMVALGSGLRWVIQSLWQLRGGQRKTRMTMRRQVPRTRAVVGTILAAKWQVLLLAVTLCAFTAGIWGLVKLFKSNNEEDLPQPPGNTLPHLSPGQGLTASTGASFDMWGAGEPQATAPSGKVSAAAVAVPPAPAKAPAAEPAAQAAAAPGKAEIIDMEDTLVKGSVKGVVPEPAAEAPPAEALDTDPPKEDPPPDQAKELPILVDKSVRLLVKGEIYGFKHYPLKDPAGLVVDIKGALPLLSDGKKDLGGAKVKSLKTLKREDGSRFIILFNGKTIPPFEIIAHKDRIEVKFM